MITNRSTKLHICLRCQRVLENGRSPLLSLFISNGSLKVPKNRHKSTVTRSPTEYNPNDDRALEFQKHSDRDKVLFRNKLGKKFESVEQIKGKDGKTANIIVLRDSILSTYRSKPKHAAPKDAPPIDILGQLGHEASFANTKEVITNIDGLRPEEEQLDSWLEFNQLVDELANGFTTVQLEQYFDMFCRKTDNENLSENTPHNCTNLILSVTPWRPDISASQKYFDNDPYRGFLFESRTMKQRLAISLIRECWNVELLPVIEGVGQFEIKIRADILEILLSGKPLPLQSFYDNVLTIDGEGLEVFWSRNVIRITTTKARKYRIVQEIVKLVKRVKILNVSLGDLMSVFDVQHKNLQEDENWIRKIFHDQTLAELKRLTGVIIRRENNRQISLGALVNDTTFLEDPVDAARRLLLTARPSNYVNENSLASADKSLAAPLSYCQIDGLNWWCKTRSWYRWTNPILKEEQLSREVPTGESSSINFLYEKNKHKNGMVIKLPSKSQISEKSTSETKWSTEYLTSTFATVGAIIHTDLDPKLQGPPLMNSKFEDSITEFSSHVPNISRLLSSAKFKKTRGYDEKAILRFLPNPYLRSKGKNRKRKSASSKVLSSMPPVEFHCSISKEKIAHFAYADAIIHQNYTDIMLPQETVDLRFHQRTTSRLVDEKLPAIADFFQQSTLNLNPNGNINILPSIVLPIPSHLCTSMSRNPSIMSLSDTNRKLKKCDHKTKDVEYLFSGFEMRRKLIFMYDSWHLEYTYIDAGKSGGARGELSLRPIKNKKGVGDQEFIDFGLELACRLTSLSTPDLTRLPKISKIDVIRIKKYYPADESKSNYPRTFLYTPRRISSDVITDENAITEDASAGLLPDYEEVVKFDDELDEPDNVVFNEDPDQI
ncbi:hypothetical protein EPUL_004115 [Erysiphe pulchra]|uniref:Uncharacterized protein n=1 Tax=Erysiphe pulchra TaxID=225359 RepID=A0A2S4PRP2_9PEZI|nr:hypothetical protein EPUL_004115 [Erysiphe pulchra]